MIHVDIAADGMTLTRFLFCGLISYSCNQASPKVNWISLIRAVG